MNQDYLFSTHFVIVVGVLLLYPEKIQYNYYLFRITTYQHACLSLFTKI